MRRGSAYGDDRGVDESARVEVIETHFAWVFLTERFVYKLKKPIRFHDLDLTTLEKRKAACELEVTLNRRLTDEIYIGIVPLSRVGENLHLGGSGTPLEWLVKMRRLNAERALDKLLAANAVVPADLDPLISKLAAFYGRTDRAEWSGPQYRAHLAAQIQQASSRLLAATDDVSPALKRLTDTQLRFIDDRKAALDERIVQSRVVDAHGDLRPEHVFLTIKPQIIDCLEFSAELRLLDTAEEISFLDLECERLGRPDLGSQLFEGYQRQCHDLIDSELYAFYRSRRALVRAQVCAWHLEDGLSNDCARHWADHRDWYLNIGLTSLGVASTLGSKP